MTDTKTLTLTKFGTVLAWLHDWYITIRYASPLTKEGRALRRAIDGDDSAEWVEVPRP